MAFAIANKHKKTGMQIRTGGRGTKWIEKATPKVDRRVIDITAKYLDGVVETIIKRLPK